MTPEHPRISLIWAMSDNGVIGRANTLPWHMPADLSHFRRITTGHLIVMGRKNYESIGKPLPQRTNIILTRDPSYRAPGCVVVHTLDEALEQTQNADEIFVIGGADIYRQFLPKADRLYLTQIHAHIDGDTFFPDYNPSLWHEIGRENHRADQKNPYPYSFFTLEKR